MNISHKSTLEYIPYAGIPWALLELYDNEIGNFVFLSTFFILVFFFARYMLKMNLVIKAKTIDETSSFKWRYEFIVGLGLLLMATVSLLIVNIFKLW